MAGARGKGPPSEEHRPKRLRSLESIAKLKDPAARLRACDSLLALDPDNPRALSLSAETMIALGQVVEGLSALHRAAALHHQRGELLLAAEVCGHLLAIDPLHQPGRALARKLRESAEEIPDALRVLDGWRRQRVREGAQVMLATARGRMAGELEPTAETRLPPVERPKAQRVSELARRQRAHAAGESRGPLASLDAPTVVEELPVSRKRAASPAAEPARAPARGGRPLFVDGAARASLQTVTDAEEKPPPRAVQTAQGLISPELVSRGRPRRLVRNELLFHEREAGHDLFLLLRGQLELIKWERSPRRARIAVLEAGAVLGELALLGDGVQHLSAKALEPCELIQISKSAVKTAFAESQGFERRLRAQYRDRLQIVLLRTSPLFVGLKPGEGTTLLGQMRPKRVPAGQVAVREGTAASALHLVLLGKLRVTVERDAETVLLGTLEDCDFFGEISLLTGEPAMATVEAQSFVQMLVMGRAEFERAIAEHEGFRRALEEESKRRERVIRAILRGTARFDERRGAVVYLPHKK